MDAGSEVPVGGLAERAEGERGRVADARSRPGVPDPELAPRAQRRRFTAAYKLSIVAQADACKHGEVGALLRLEGLYSSLLTEWRNARDSGALGALEPKPRGPRPPSPERVENVLLRRQLDRAQADLQTARRVIEVQGNVSALLEDLLSKGATPNDEPQQSR